MLLLSGLVESSICPAPMTVTSSASCFLPGALVFVRQSDAGLQELELEQTQLCLHEANLHVNDLTLELERSARTQAEQYSKLTLQLEYTAQVTLSQNYVAPTPPSVSAQMAVIIGDEI